MGPTVTLTMQDQETCQVMAALDGKRCSVQQAARLLELSIRQTRRKLRVYREADVAGIPHGNRGRRPANALGTALRKTVEDLARDTYPGYNNHHLRDTLEDDHGVSLSVSSVRRIRLGAKLSSPRKRRPAKGHCLRERMAQPGMMLQLDGSPYAWLGPEHPAFTVLAAIDDATGEAFALFRQEEDTVGYMLLLRDIIRQRGLPQSLYTDRHTIFRAPSKDTLSIDDQLAGKRPESQFDRAARQLGVRIITAHSPQAKGRVERLHNTFQDRLANELKTAQITTLDDANAFLKGFLPRYNRRFAKPPADPTSAYRPAPSKGELDHALALHFTRTAGKDNAVNFGGRRLLVTKSRAESYAKKRITVRVALDGKLSFWYRDQCLGKGPTAVGELRADPGRLADLLPQPDKPEKPAPLKKPRATAKPKAADPPQSGVTPKPDHPWRKFRFGKADRQLLQSARRPGG